MEFAKRMGSLRAAITLAVLSLSIVCVRAQAEIEPKTQGRHITAEQTKVLEKALANEPKGTIAFESLGLFPPPPSAPSPPSQLPASKSTDLKPLITYWNQQQKSSDSVAEEYAEIHTFTEQLWNLLKENGYDPFFQEGSHVLPPKGISIRVIDHKGRPVADELCKSLNASGIQNVKIEEDSKEEAYYLKHVPSYKVLLKITIGSE